MISSQDMKKLEEKAVELGISKIQLMENAAKGSFKVLNEKFDLKNKEILVVCYHGNNGGDGFALARYLCDIAEVNVLFIGQEDKLANESAINYKRISHNEKIQIIDDDTMLDFDDFDIIIDAMLGIGFHGYLRQEILEVIGRINSSKAIKVALDLPTGINADTAEKAEKYVNADLIITFHDMKLGLIGWEDKTVVVDIGLGE